MDIKSIRQILNSDAIDNETKERMVLSIIAKDKKAIPYILSIIDFERSEKDELISDSNAELSRALITLQDPNIGKKKPKPIVEIDFVIGEIKKHYIKWQHTIKCNFKVKGLP